MKTKSKTPKARRGRSAEVARYAAGTEAECPECQGGGEGLKYPLGGLYGPWIKCRTCNGTGCVSMNQTRRLHNAPKSSRRDEEQPKRAKP